MKAPDPRIRVILGVLTIVIVLVSPKRWPLGLELGVFLALGLSLFGWRNLLGSLRLSGPMVAMVALVGGLSFSWEDALEMGLRFMNLVVVSFLLFRWLTVEELAQALGGLGVPWSFCFIVLTSMRYVSLVGRRLKSISEAQRSRGIDLRPRLKNLPNIVALAVPLLVQCFQLSEDLAMALEVRGFSRKVQRKVPQRRIAPWEYALVLGWIVLIILVSRLAEVA